MVWIPCLIIANKRVCLLFVFLDRTSLCFKYTYVKTKISILSVYNIAFLIQGSISSLMIATYVQTKHVTGNVTNFYFNVRFGVQKFLVLSPQRQQARTCNKLFAWEAVSAITWQILILHPNIRQEGPTDCEISARLIVQLAPRSGKPLQLSSTEKTCSDIQCQKSILSFIVLCKKELRLNITFEQLLTHM
jgi:hypothetical protein